MNANANCLWVKEKSVYFRTGARFKVRNCKHSAILTVDNPDSRHFKIDFNRVTHKEGHLAANKIVGKDRDKLATFFAENPTDQPSDKYREDFIDVDVNSFAAGYLSGPCTASTPYQQLAASLNNTRQC